MYNNQFTTQYSYSLQLNQIQNFGVPTSHQDLPPQLNQHWGTVNEILRDVIFALHTPNYETPGNYIVNVYSAGGWNNQMMTGLQNMVAHWLYFEGNKAKGQEFNIRAVLEDALTLHVFLKFNNDLNTWINQFDYNFASRFLVNGPNIDQYFQGQVAPWVSYTLQQNAQQRYPQQQPQHHSQPYNGPQTRAPQQQQAPVSMGMGTPRPYQHPQQPARPAAGMSSGKGSYGVKDLVERRNQTQQPVAPRQEQQPAPQAKPQPSQGDGRLFLEEDIDKVTLVKLCSNYGTFKLNERVEDYLNHQEYHRCYNDIHEKHLRRIELLEANGGLNTPEADAEIAQYTEARLVLGASLVRNQYRKHSQVIKTNERPFDTKSQVQMLREVFTVNASAYFTADETKAVVMDNREYLLYPSNNPFVNILIKRWRNEHPLTHNFGYDHDASEFHFYRLIQYHPSEPILVEDVYLENPAMSQKEFDMSLHMPFAVDRPIERIVSRNDEILKRNPNPTIIVPEGEPEKISIVVNRRRLVSQSARQAVNVAKAARALAPEEKDMTIAAKHITATRYDVPHCLYLTNAEDKEFHQRFMNDIKSGALGTLDSIAARLKTSKLTNKMSTDYYDFLNGYLARRLFNMVNHTMGYNACILEGGFVEEWESIKKDIFVKIPAFLLDIWRRNETAYIREQFNYIVGNEFNQDAIEEYLSNFAEQLPYPRDAETGELMIPTDVVSDVEPTAAQMAAFFDIAEAEFDNMNSNEYTDYVNNYKETNGNGAVVPVKFTLDNTVVIVDKFVAYEVPYTINDLGILNTYSGDTKRAVHSDGHPLMDLVATINSDMEATAGARQQLVTKDGYIVDIIRSVANNTLFSFVLREAE